MAEDGPDPLQQTIDGQAERIMILERQLEARTAALDAATRDPHSTSLRAHSPRAPQPPPWMPWRVRVRTAILLVGGRLLPEPAKRFLKKFWNPWPQRRVASRPPQPHPSKTATYDVICFSIIDWSFRWQRPQQLLSQFADAGHRVFVFKITAFLPHGPAAFEIARVRPNVWEVTIAPPVVIDVYAGEIDPETAEWFPSMLEEMRRQLDIVCAVSLVQVATWREVAEEARRRFGWKIVYDCMDEWTSFPGMQPPLLEAEERLVAEADLVTVSARRLFEKWRGRSARIALVRNATDFGHFTAPQSERHLDEVKRPIAGYYGAIAPWFDVGLLARIAAKRPQYSFVVIGGVFDVNVRPLRKLPNVHLLGQQPYARMPDYLRDFDVCMIPFVVNEITAATDPVKFYEYISLGKPVVSTFMPELEPFGDLLYLAGDEDDFLGKLDVAIAERAENDQSATLRARRIEAARANTWTERAAVMRRAVRDAHPRVSILIVSYDNQDLTRACIESVLHHSMHPNIEVIIVDNASTDGSAEMLEAFRDDRVRVLRNRENAGFAAANNQALRLATGTYLVLLNNDTVVPRGWLPRMLRHLQVPQIGLAVASTNFSGNESCIDVPYATTGEMPPFAEQYMRQHDGQRFDIRVAAMYCMGMRRDVYERIGPLDEKFGAGMFEDDDYSHRARLAGFRVVCAEDVFVHHVGQASLSKLAPEAYGALWKRNQAHFENKWGVVWEPHQRRRSSAAADGTGQREWRIGIVGTFDVENYGDLLFPLIAEAELRARLGSVTLDRFSYRQRTPPDWPYPVTSIADLPQVIGDLDGLLIGGGFLIRFDKGVADGYAPPEPEIHHPTGYWLTPALIALERGVPVVWNAPGMHCNEIPEWAEPLLKLALGLSSYISVRDEPSRVALSGFVDDDRIVVTHDTGFGVSRLIGSGESPEMQRVRELVGLTGPYIVIQPVRWRDEGFPSFLEEHAERFSKYQLLALPIGPVLGDHLGVLGTALPQFVQLPFWPQPLLLAELISHASAVIGYSYHLAITALASGVPVFTSVDLSAGKFTALRDFESLYPLASINESGPDVFFSRLGKTEPAQSVRATAQPLAEHWDRIAAAIRKGRGQTQPAFSRFWQSLPGLLERSPAESQQS